MQIVIDIPDETYRYMQEHFMYYGKNSPYLSVLEKVGVAIREGVPLPKGHGDLIDRSKIYKAIPAEEDNCTGMGMTYEEMDAYNDGINSMFELVQYAPTIIEADTESEEL